MHLKPKNKKVPLREVFWKRGENRGNENKYLARNNRKLNKIAARN